MGYRSWKCTKVSCGQIIEIIEWQVKKFGKTMKIIFFKKESEIRIRKETIVFFSSWLLSQAWEGGSKDCISDKGNREWQILRLQTSFSCLEYGVSL